MENVQFKFTGLTWMKPEQLQAIRKQLIGLEQFGIKFEIVLNTDVQLYISDYDEVLQSFNDDHAVTFVKKFSNEFESSNDGIDEMMNEDCLLIFTFDDDMNIEAKLLTYWGNIQEVQL